MHVIAICVLELRQVDEEKDAVMPDAMISLVGLVKSFGRVHALDGLDMRVETGEVHGFLGPNGAGKTTTLRVLLGMLRATAGAVQLLGGDPWRDAVALHKRLAYVPGDVALWPQLTGGEAIDVLCALHGVPISPGASNSSNDLSWMCASVATPTPKGTVRKWR